MIRITIVAGAEPFIYDYEGDRELTIGRLASNDVSIAHADVSRTHCSIVPVEGGFRVRDHASRNGIVLNGRRVADSPIQPGDEIAIGEEVRIYFGGSPPPLPPSGIARSARSEPTSDDEEEGAPAPGHALPRNGSDEGAAAARTGLAEERAEDGGERAGPLAPGARREGAGAKESGEYGFLAERQARPPDSGGGRAARAAPTEAGRAVLLLERRQRERNLLSLAMFGGLILAVLAIAYGLMQILVPGGEEGERAGTARRPNEAAPVAGPGAPPVLPLPEARDHRRYRDGEDEREWARLDSLELAPELMAGALEAFAARFPRSAYAPAARLRASSLRRLEEASRAGQAAPALEAEIDSCLRAGELAEAYFLAGAALRLGLADERAQSRLRAKVERAAYERFASYRDRAREALREGRALEAYELVLREGAALRRFPFFAEVESELNYMKRSVELALLTGSQTASPPAGERMLLDKLAPEARRALIACDFDGALERYRQILALPLTEEERLAYQWRIFDVRRARELFSELLARLAQTAAGKAPPLQVTIAQSIKGEACDGDAEKVVIRALVPGAREKPVITKKWKDLPPVQVLELLNGLQLDGDGLLALAAYCFEADYEQEAARVLAAVLEAWPAYRAEAAALLRRKSGLDVPPGDLVVYEGRVIARSERDAIEKKRAEARAEAARIKAELQAAKRESLGQKYYEQAIALLDQGHFVEGRQILVEIANRFRDSEVGKLAKARAEDNFLRRRALRTSGRDENRMSISFLAEGYVIENEFQKSFDMVADRARTFVEKAEPFAEYSGYFNYYALNLASAENGVSREPGGVRKDTALHGIVRDGVFTVANDLARGFVERFPGPSQAYCIGNDNASVATGGGGVVAAVKGMIDTGPHELGHAIASLGDEYDFDPSGRAAGPKKRATEPLPTEVIAPNLVRGNQKDDMRKKAPWAHWIALGAANWTGKVVDLFEGGDRTTFDVWRGQSDCRMRTSSSNFCCVCMEQMVLRLYGSVRPIDEVDPREEKLETTVDEAVALKAVVLRPRTRPLVGRWTVLDVRDTVAPDGSTVTREQKPREVAGKEMDLPDGRRLYTVGITKLQAGLYDVTLTVSDPTPWVAQKDRSPLEEKRTWRVRVRER